jgi:hypothetical protein
MEMIGGTEIQLGSLELKQFLPKIVGESWISVNDNRMRHAMKFEYIIHKKLSHCGCGEWVLKSTKLSIFGKTINYHHDDRLISQFRETNNEIHRNIPSNSRGNWKWLEHAWRFEYLSLIALTCITFNHKGVDVLFHTIPQKRMFDLFIGFGKP